MSDINIKNLSDQDSVQDSNSKDFKVNSSLDSSSDKQINNLTDISYTVNTNKGFKTIKSSDKVSVWSKFTKLFNFKNLKSNFSIFGLSKSKSVLAIAVFLLSLSALVYGASILIDNVDKTAKAAGADPTITLGLSQKSGTAPFSGTCTPGGNTYTPGEDACDTDNVVRTLDIVEFTYQVGITVDNATNLN